VARLQTTNWEGPKGRCLILRVINPSMKHLLLCLATAMSTAVAQPGRLDLTFGTGGKIISNNSAPNVNVIDAVLQPDCKTLVLASADYDHISRLVLVRYQTNGTPDSSFGTAGVVNAPLYQTGRKDFPNAFRLQPNGKILVCGNTLFDNGTKGFIARYNTDGSFDPTFNSTGVLYIQDSAIYTIKNLALLPSGEMVLLSSYYTFGSELVLIKLNANGTRSTGFGTNGVATVNATDSYDPTYTHIEIQADGKLLVGGNPYRYTNLTGLNNFVLIRINANGTLDNTYGTNGKLELDAGPAPEDDFGSMELQPDGKVVVCGTGQNDLQFLYTYTLRITPNGTLDASYGTNGYQYLNASANGFGSVGRIALQPDGKVLIAGFAKNTSGNYDITAVRLTSSGVPDGSFGAGGLAAYRLNAFGSYGIRPLLQSNGKVVLVGFGGNGQRLSVTFSRLEANGQMDVALPSNGKIIVPIGNESGSIAGKNILVQPDQKIVNVCTRSNGFSVGLSLSRYLPNGATDTSFGSGGQCFLDLPGYFYNTYAGLLRNGTISVVSDFYDFVKGRCIGLFRFLPNGQPDSAFGSNGKRYITTNATSVNWVIHAAIQPDGKIVILSPEAAIGPQPDRTYILRLLANGDLDPTFNGTGKIELPDTANASFGHVMVQPDGKILLTYNSINAGQGYHAFLRRFSGNGTTDAGFNNGQSVATELDNPLMTMQPDGKILLADRDSKIVRLTANGSFDASFDGNGIAEPVYSLSELTSIQLQPDGKLLLGGHQYSSAGLLNFETVRILPNGQLDNAYGTNGISLIEAVPGKNNYGEDLALQAGGGILLTGYTEDENMDYEDFTLIRLQNNLPTANITYTFTGNGNWDVPANWNNSLIPPVALPAGSSIIINPVVGGECVLNGIQYLLPGASITVSSGKKMVVQGGLILR
jgi:uncharacterized delta-60 repeat protein